MPITNPEAIRFTNEVCRPLAEKARAFKAEVLSAQTVWFAGMDAEFPNDSSAIDDGRESEGVSRLIGSDINSLMGDLFTMAAAANDGNLSKPCVRPLSAT